MGAAGDTEDPSYAARSRALQPPPIIIRLLEDHRRLDVVLRVVESHVRERDFKVATTLDLLSCLTDYIVEYPERVHHPREERITERMVDKGLTPSERVLVELTVSQHAELTGWTARIAQDVDRLLTRRQMADERFITDFREYVDLQRQHMCREEQQVFPLAIRLLSLEDWQHIERSDDTATDVASEGTLDRFRSLYALVESSSRPPTR